MSFPDFEYDFVDTYYMVVVPRDLPCSRTANIVQLALELDNFHVLR